MDTVGAIPDIPKLYTALAEWCSCVMYISICVRRWPRVKDVVILLSGLAALISVQIAIGIVPVSLWLPGMAVALAIMTLMFRLCCRFDMSTCLYWLMRSFLLAEFAASLDWQLYFYLAEQNDWETNRTMALAMQILMLIVVYGMSMGIAAILDLRHLRNLEDTDMRIGSLNITMRELSTAVIIAITTFALSNLSYVSTATPFTSAIGTEVFNIRTLVGFGGGAFLYAYHIQLCEQHAMRELSSIRNILQAQYLQYQQSKENIAIINRKYHDLKHQIAVLRNETDPGKREVYLDDIEQGIKQYESQYKTGNAVLDTILTSKALGCAKDDIELTCVADGTLLGCVSEMDMCTLVGNALDNAIEYERLLDDGERRLIHVTVSRVNGFVLIRVENYINNPGAFVIRNGLPVTTKGNTDYHGFGLKSIRYTAMSYGGTLTVTIRDHWFDLRVLIPLRSRNGTLRKTTSNETFVPSSSDNNR